MHHSRSQQDAALRIRRGSSTVSRDSGPQARRTPMNKGAVVPKIPHDLLQQRRESQPLQSRSNPKNPVTAPLYLPVFSGSRLDLRRCCPSSSTNSRARVWPIWSRLAEYRQVGSIYILGKISSFLLPSCSCTHISSPADESASRMCPSCRGWC